MKHPYESSKVLCLCSVAAKVLFFHPFRASSICIYRALRVCRGADCCKSSIVVKWFLCCTFAPCLALLQTIYPVPQPIPCIAHTFSHTDSIPVLRALPLCSLQPQSQRLNLTPALCPSRQCYPPRAPSSCYPPEAHPGSPHVVFGLSLLPLPLAPAFPRWLQWMLMTSANRV
jgi:hypothetical protein